MLKAAVIGVGAMGRHHARIYAQMPATQLVGVADIDAEAGARAARLHNTETYTNYHQLLGEVRADVVSVVVPGELHHQVTLDAMNAGCHVLVEKPIATTEEQAQELIEQADVLGRKLMVGHVFRFGPALQELKKRLEAGEVGRIFQIHCRRLGPFPTRVHGVGVILDLAVHDLDLMCYLTGQDVVRVYAATAQRVHAAHEDQLIGTVHLADGTIGVLDTSWLTPTKVRDLTVTGERGMFRVDHLLQDLYFYENAEVDSERWDAMSMLFGVGEGRMIRYPVSKYEPLLAELEAFVQAVVNDTPVPVTGADGLRALRLAHALIQSGRKGEVIHVES